MGAVGPVAVDNDRLVLAPAVHAVAVDEDMVFLDVARDAYFCLPGARSVLDLSSDRRRLRVQDRSLAAEFATAGFLADHKETAHRPDWIAPLLARASAVEAHYEGPARGDVVAATGALIDLLGAYRGRNLRQLLASVERAPSAARPALSPRLFSEVHAFHRWIPYAPVSGKCLLRSFMLLRHLRRRGLDAMWVFGVRTWPFHAHCWLQIEDVVLDDQFDRVRGFAPILVV
jgi:hypothetical protein